MRTALSAYVKEHNLIRRGNHYYRVVARSRPTKFLGWALFDTSLMNDTGVQISRFYKTKDEVLQWCGGALRPTWEVRRVFKSKGKQHLEPWRIPHYIRTWKGEY